MGFEGGGWLVGRGGIGLLQSGVEGRGTYVSYVFS